MLPVTVFRGLHHCFFGRQASCRLQFLDVSEPLPQSQQQSRLVFAGDRFLESLMKCCRVLCRAGEDFFVQHSQDLAA